jgi:hypothetical protein
MELGYPPPPTLVLLVLPLPENAFNKVIIVWWYFTLLNWDFAESIFTASFASQGVHNKDTIAWKDGAKLHPISFIGPTLAWK